MKIFLVNVKFPWWILLSFFGASNANSCNTIALNRPNSTEDCDRKNINNIDDKIPQNLLITLRKKLLRNYNSYTRPIKNSSEPILIEIGFMLLQINNLDEMFQVSFLVNFKLLTVFTKKTNS
jgi:hypothetical protein